MHLTTVHHPYDPRIYHKECLSLYRAGFDVTLIAQGDKKHFNKSLINFIPIKRYKNRLSRMLFGTIAIFKKARKIDADVYHFHDPELMPIGWLLKKKNNIVIYDIHEDYVTSILQKKYLPKPIRNLIAKLYKLFENIFINKFNLCLAEKYYKEMYPEGKCILNYPINNRQNATLKSSNVQMSNKLLYTGNISTVRGALIHAKLPQIDENITVEMIGKCPKDLAEEMMTIAGHRKESLKIKGIDEFIEKEEIDEAYIKGNWLAGLALFPPTEHYKKKELTKFFEYMNAGIPIICSDFPVWKDFVERYECGIAVDPFNHEEIKQAIQYLKNNPNQARIMSLNGKCAVMKELNWRIEEKELIDWYSQLLRNINK